MARIADTASQDLRLSPAGRPLWRRYGPLLLGLVVLIALLWQGWQHWHGASRSVARERLRTAVVTRERFIAEVSAQGRVVAAVSPTLYAPAAGLVTMAVAAGETVRKGQLLAQLESPEVTNELARETANLDGLRSAVARQRVEARTRQSQGRLAVELAQVNVRAAERELARAQEAGRRGVLPEIEVARRGDELAVAQARARHTQEEAQLLTQALEFELRTREQDVARQALLVNNLRRRSSELSVRAPVAGVIGSLAVAQKAAVSINQPLLTVVDLSALEVEIQVPESYADSLAINMPAEVQLGEQAHAGRLTAISPEVQNSLVTGRVRFDGAPPAELRQNQRVSVRVVLDTRAEVVQVARGPFLDSDGGRSAYVVQDGIARRRAIRIGAASATQVEILDGLAVGEEIVISGTDSFGGADSLRLR